MITLMKHQEKAVAEITATLEDKKICLLSGECRSGKSFTALEVANRVGGDVLFITKKKAMASVEADALALGMTCRLTTINYESIHKVEVTKWSLIVCDEAHSSITKRGKPSSTYLKVQTHFMQSGAMALMMSGTLFPETYAQAYPIVAVTCRGPWLQFRDFYSWWNQAGHYKTKASGGYGIAGATKRIRAGMTAPDYDQVNEAKILNDIKPFMVKMTRLDAGFDVVKSEVKAFSYRNDKMEHITKNIMKDGYIQVMDTQGIHRECVYEGPAQRLQGAHMLTGGTLIDEAGEAFVLNDRYSPVYRWGACRAFIQDHGGKQFAIMTTYIHERIYLLELWGDEATDDYEAFKAGGFRYWVCSLMKHSMGFDLSWMDGCQILYSIPWSGSHWAQVGDRQLKHDRTEKAVVGVPLMIGGLDNYVYKGVTEKGRFNASIYKEIR